MRTDIPVIPQAAWPAPSPGACLKLDLFRGEKAKR
jgi:hypothetical protein